MLGAIIVGGVWYYINSYQDRVYPGVKIGQYDLGGLTKKEVKNFIENINNRFANEGIEIIIDSEVGPNVKINTVASGESAFEMFRIDSDAVSIAALRAGRRGENTNAYFDPLYLRFFPSELIVPVVANDDILKSELSIALSSYEDKVRNATVSNVQLNGAANIIEEKSGRTFDYDLAVASIRNNVSHISFQPIVLKRSFFSPTVTKPMIEAILPDLGAILKFGPLIITDPTSSTPEREWVITERELAGLVGVRATDDGRAVFSLNKDELEKYLKNVIAPEVEVPAKNAKFTVENNKVIEFQNSSDGKVVDLDATYLGLNNLFEVRNSLILHNTNADRTPLVLKTLLPDVRIANSNEMGIVELIGSGTSTFRDSHTRRIQNIAHAVERLNGTLIKPGEEFSATKAAGPFTLENGYLPESVIKGRTLKDEVGGGMCQIGTTLFRMAMQSGLPITERHNHSLVVSYYLDPVNGNPGTDATLYEPILDLKFLNETGNHLLLLTDIDYKKQLLTFSLWGTNDGRSGWFSRPKVSRWIPAPAETEYIVASVNSNGKPITGESCQVAFRGAVASFTYTRITPEGEKIERVFDSYYRPLPRICTIPPSSTPAVVTP
jgi:vancomycin resistance protein YoaR